MSEPSGPSNRFDPSTAFYAWVGASDLALEAARKAAAEVQTQLEEARLQLRDLQRDPKGAVDQARTRVQAQLDTAARQLEQRAAEIRHNLGGRVDWEGLAARGHRVVGKAGAEPVDPQQPAPPAAETPAAGTPAAGTPAAGTPAPETPAPQTLGGPTSQGGSERPLP